MTEFGRGMLTMLTILLFPAVVAGIAWWVAGVDKRFKGLEWDVRNSGMEVYMRRTFERFELRVNELQNRVLKLELDKEQDDGRGSDYRRMDGGSDQGGASPL